MISQHQLIKHLEGLRYAMCSRPDLSEGSCECKSGSACHSLLICLVILRSLPEDGFKAYTQELLSWVKDSEPPPASARDAVFFVQPYGGCAPSVSFSDTSRSAAESMQASLGELQQLVLDLVRRSGKHGITCDEVETEAALRHQTASARLRELVLKDVICDTMIRRPTRSGRLAAVYRIKRKSNGD